MKTTVNLVCFALMMLVLAACNSNGKYVEGNGTVYHTYWTFSFGNVYNELPQVDAATFKSVNDWIGRDARHVYFKSRLVEGADAATVEACRYPLMKDKNDYYYAGAALHVSSVDEFKQLKWSDNDLWARDGRYAYYDTIVITSPDIESFRVTSKKTAADSRYVYRFGKILPLADPATYDEDWKGLYSRDKSHIWYCGRLLRDADYGTFAVDGFDKAHDKYGSFDGDERVARQDSIAEPVTN